MSEKRPAFQWYPKDILTDENVLPMTLEEEGAYRRLIDFCWLHGSLPNNVAKLAPMCKIDGSRMALLWPAIEPCFRTDPNDFNRLIHPRLERERRKQDDYRKDKSRAGKAGAKARWEKEQNGTPTFLPMAKHGSSSSSASSTAVKESVGKKKKVALPDTWKPSTAHREMADSEGVNLGRETERFRDHAKANGRVQLDWDSSFRNWLRKAGEMNGKKGNGPGDGFSEAKFKGEWTPVVHERPSKPEPDPETSGPDPEAQELVAEVAEAMRARPREPEPPTRTAESEKQKLAALMEQEAQT